MNDKLRRIFGQGLIAFGPFMMLGIVIACIIGLIILSYYLLLSGIIIGVILWLYTQIRRYFLKMKSSTYPKKGRIIDHDTKD